MLATYYRFLLIQLTIFGLVGGLFTYLLISSTIQNTTLLANNRYNSNEDYSYYLLAVQKWCSNKYQIHGLWPQFNHNDWPSNCEKVSYISPNGDLLNAMNANWSTCNNNDALWQHEWTKHGSCVEQQFGLGENGYFNLALKLFNENPDLLTHCKGRDCTMGCFNLDGSVIPCP